MYKVLETSASTFPEKTALRVGGRDFSYRELERAAHSVASLLAESSSFQDRVLIYVPNSFEYVACYFGVLKAGRVAVPIDPAIQTDALQARAKESGAVLCLSSATLGPKCKSAIPHVPLVEAARALAHRGAAEEKRQVKLDDLTAILFTTGTTGAPKGVMVRHANARAATDNILKVLKYSAATIDVNPLPLTHSFGLGNVHAVFGAGGTVLLYRNFINLKTILEERPHSAANHREGFIPHTARRFLHILWAYRGIPFNIYKLSQRKTVYVSRQGRAARKNRHRIRQGGTASQKYGRRNSDQGADGCRRLLEKPHRNEKKNKKGMARKRRYRLP